MAREAREMEQGKEARAQTSEELRDEAALRRAQVKRTAAALEDRLRERAEQIGQAIDRTRDKLEEVDEAAHRYRYVLIGAAVGLGFMIARRGSRQMAMTSGTEDGVRYVMVQRPERPGVLRSLLGGLTALALRQGMDWVVRRLDEPEEPEGQRQLPPPGRRP
jgi:ElaB/YqjD/DUF883 family membrane-anchored ribosome-binding protein